ncbi:MAG: efflux RND transporter permease subunit [Chloroflexi bacterium]|nr:efflux RND transporter permease subunit [Chloroflexota bacterium]MYD47546.1 efflux RND transporter permease subunit [Chloroflexota bacterium]
MSFLTELALRRKPVTIMVMVLLLAAGLYSYDRLSQELFPEISFGTIFVITGYQQDPNTVADEITTPIEDSILGMAHLREVTSISTSNQSQVVANFETDADIEEIEQEIRTEVSALNLPDVDWGPVVIRLTSDIFPVMYLSVSGERDIPSLQRVVDDQIVPRLEAVNGVYNVEVRGGISERVSIIVDPELLAQHDLTIQHVISSVSANAADISAGSISHDDKSVVLRTYFGYSDLDTIRSIPVGYTRSPGPPTGDAAGTPVPLSAVASVAIDTPEADTVVRTNDNPSISLRVLRLPEANTIDITNEILALIDELPLPPDVNLEVIYNDGPELEKQLSNVASQGVQGFGIAVLAIFLFLLQIRPTAVVGILHTLRPTAIIAISIPMSIMITLLVMAVFDWAINFMSLAGLAISVGRIVDDSIVVLENTYRHVQAGEPRATAALRGAREVGPAIIASTLTTVAVFLPLAFIPGIVGQFFLPFAQTVCVSLVASTLVALTAVPALGSLLLRENDMASESDGAAGGDTWLQRIYTPPLLWALRRRFIVVGACIIVVAASLSLITVLPITLFSEGETISVRVDVTMPENTDASTMFRQVREIEQILATFVSQGDIETYQVTMGALSDEFGPSTAETGYDVAGFLIPVTPDTPSDFPERLRAELPQRENARIQLFVDRGGPPQADLEVTVRGDEFADVQAGTQSLVQRLGEVPGVINLKTNISDTSEELTFTVDPAAAARYGLTTQAVAGQVRAWVYGSDVGDVNLMGDSYDIIVRGRSESVDEITELQQLPIGGVVGSAELGAISEVKASLGPSVITHYDGTRSATITGEFQGRDRQAIAARVDGVIDGAELPAGVNAAQGGFASDIEEQFQNVYVAMIIGVSLVYLVMVASMGSLRDPFIVVLNMPLAIVGALVALVITDRTLSLPAMMGFLFLIGIVVTNAIVLLTFVRQLRAQGYDAFDAVVEAGRTRLRPILMTAFTTILAIFPLAFSDDSGLVGAELATVVIGGLVSSTFLTLVAVPVTYMLLHETIPSLPGRITRLITRQPASQPTPAAD